MRIQIELIFLILSIYFRCSMSSTGGGITNGVDIDVLVDNAIEEAGDILNKNRFVVQNRYNPLGQVRRNQTSVKFTALTEAIGESSNENLLAFEILQNDVDRDFAIAALFNHRHPFCTERLMRCNSSEKYRTINGTCNNLRTNNQMWGASFTKFNRLIPHNYADNYNMPVGGDGIRFPISLPSPRLISRTIHFDRVQKHFRVTNMLPQFGQFLDHDISLTPEGDKRCCSGEEHFDCFPINIPANDSFYSTMLETQKCMDFTRSTAFCFPTSSGNREQMNVITSYVDASNVYGSEEERLRLVRSFVNGKLRTHSTRNYPPTKVELERTLGEKIEFTGTYVAGDQRVNENPALLTLHTLWIREHNRIAELMQQLRPNLSDEEIFQETRRLVIAEMQNIVYGEYLPVLLGFSTMEKFMLTLDDQHTFYNSSVDATVFNSFATAAYRFGHTFVNGLVQLMQGLVNVGSYRLRDNFGIANEMTRDGGKGYDFILGGLMIQNAQNFDPFFSEDLTNFVLRSPSAEFGADLVARNIQRGRDHGLPPFMKYRKYCGLKTSNSWSVRPRDIRKDSWYLLQTLYETPEDIDLFSGGVIEIPQSGALTGPTFNCLKAIQFQRIKDGDRFFFTHANQVGSFDLGQLAFLRNRTLGDVICDNSAVEMTPKNVFLVRSSSNPIILCNDTSRGRIEL